MLRDSNVTFNCGVRRKGKQIWKVYVSMKGELAFMYELLITVHTSFRSKTTFCVAK